MDKHKLKNIFSKRKKIFIVALTIIVITSLIVLFFNGFIPIGLTTKSPVGKVEEMEINQFIDKYPELNDIPDHEKILSKVYGSDKQISFILDDYKEKLENEGYELKYQGSGSITGKNFEYVGYLKGITAVGIIVTSETNVKYGNETIVVYMTGNAFDFIPLINWYQQKFS